MTKSYILIMPNFYVFGIALYCMQIFAVTLFDVKLFNWDKVYQSTLMPVCLGIYQALKPIVFKQW